MAMRLHNAVRRAGEVGRVRVMQVSDFYVLYNGTMILKKECIGE
jgi:hypothetical protein